MQTLHLAEILAGTGAGERSTPAVSGAAAKEALADRQLRRQPAQGDDDDPRQARARRRRGPRLGGAARGRPRDQGRGARPPRRVPRSSSRPPSTAAGGHVHWARDAAEANRIVLEIARAHGVTEVVKVKSLTTDEIGLNEALAAGGVEAIETDFAELILQLDGDWSSHILVPAIHRNRTEIRDLFRRTIADRRRSPTSRATSPRPRALYLREKFLHARMAVSGANFGVAETGTVVRRRVRGQRPDVHDAAAGARDRSSASRSSSRPSPTSRCSCSCFRARRPASG